MKANKENSIIDKFSSMNELMIKKNSNITSKQSNNKVNINTIKRKTLNKDNIIYNYYNNFNDYEMNNLKYKEALKVDKRTFFQYYFSLLKRKQILLFTFYTSNDYNARTIKISLFLFTFTLNYAVNTFIL